MDPLLIGVIMIVSSAVAMFIVALYYSRRLAVEYRLNGAYAVLCSVQGVGQHLVGNTWVEYIAYALAVLFAYAWWDGGGGDDTKRRLKAAGKKFTPIRRTASATG